MASLPKLDSTDGVSKPDELVGCILNERYEIIRLLNEGGMAKIYLAKHTVLGREVAIKVLKSGCADDTEMMQRFINEGRAAGTLGHPNIVECTDIGTTPNDKPYLVLELLAGHSLADEMIRIGQLAVGRAARIGLRIADALATAHAAGIVHRDLKSDNVFLARRRGTLDVVKVLDFGISKFDFDRAGTQKGSMLGTPDFMAPEQVVDAGSVDARADIYALGVILYEMLAGCRPFHGIPFPMVLYAIANDPPPSLESLRNELPAELIVVVDKAMSKRPEDRYATMMDVAAALEPFADRISVDSMVEDRVSGSFGRVSFSSYAETLAGPADEKRRSSSGAAAPISSTLSDVVQKKGRISLATALGAAGVAIAIGFGAYVLTRRNEAPVPAVAVLAPQQEMITVDFSVMPPDALVEVDGRLVELVQGALKLRGIAGSVKHVRAFVGSHEARAQVVISLDGAMPAHIEVNVPVPSAIASAISPPPALITAPVRVKQKEQSVAPQLRDDR